MKERRKKDRLNLISFSESEMYAASIYTNNQDVNMEKVIPQSLFVVFDRKTDKVIGYFIDISIGGLLIIGQVPFEKNAEYQFKMDFSSIMDDEPQIQFDVRCVWVINNEDIECYISGFEFTKISRKDIGKIRQLINRYNIKD